MRQSKKVPFFVGLTGSALLLLLVPVDDTRVALLRVEHALNRDTAIREAAAAHCNEINGRPGVVEERFFIRRIALEPRAEGATARPCQITVESAHATRFALRTYSHFLVRLTNLSTGSTIYQRSFRVEFPRPLCLLPIAAFLLALLFDVRSWGIGLTLATYVFGLSGANAIQMGNLVWQVTGLTLFSDPMFLGMLLILSWLALFLSGREPVAATPESMPVAERTVNRVATALVGLWNPGVYAALGKLFSPARASMARAASFLDAQLAISCLSLYLLTINTDRLLDAAENALLLPRYFTFSALLFLALNHVNRRSQREVVIARYPRLWLAGLFVVGVELAAHYTPALADFPTIVRVGMALLASELLWPVSIRPRAAFRSLGPWAAMLFLGAFVASTSHTTGVSDLVIALASPRIHPTLFVFLMFAAGVTLGFLTGNFAASFFALLLAVRTPEAPLARAALLDGILAGTLLSPFSVHNLIPASQFGIRLHHLVAYRWRQLAFPFAIGGVIYAVAAINSVAILQPVTFVFLCLVALAFQLKKRTWTIGNIRGTGFVPTNP